MPSISETKKPVLSNRLSDLAERAGEAARAYRRGSIESIEAYLSAGALLAEARGECRRRGDWGAVLNRAGVAGRTAQRMVQAWRMSRQVGAGAEAIHEAGGVQAWVASVLADMQAALHAAAGVLDGEGRSGIEASLPDSEADAKPVLKTPIERAGEPPVGAVERAVEGERHPPASSPARLDSAPFAPRADRAGSFPLSSVERRRRERARRRERGECLDCGADTDGIRVRCARCRSRIARADGRRREDARLGAVLGVRIREAARQGRGVRLTAADVAGLVEGERGRFRERLAKVGRSPKERKRRD